MRRFHNFLSLATALVCVCPSLTAARPAPRTSPQQQSSSANSAAKPAPAKKKTTAKKRSAKREPTQKAPTPQRISEIQSALARDGFYQGEPNGKWDSNTIGAMQKFQSSKGLEPSGKLDALSLQKLGLGSSVAGVSAPKPPTPPAPASPAVPAANPAAPSSQQPSLGPSAAGASTQSVSSASAPKPPRF
jgi:peptidoglycan hydrolase-like protein with peptidoglycan-binding domain